MTSRLAPASRHAFRHEGRVVYEWEQTIEEVCLFVQVPAGVRARDLGVSIAAREVSVGIRGNPPYLQHALHAPCVTADSTWTLDGGELAITLAKVRRSVAMSVSFESYCFRDLPQRAGGHDGRPAGQGERTSL